MASLPAEFQTALSRPSQLVVWVGAGISRDSKLPMGDELTKALLISVFQHASVSGVRSQHCLERIVSLYRLIYGNSRSLPRLEFVLDRLRKILGDGPYSKLFTIFGTAKPNSAHYALASLAQRGARIITANFDTLLEAAGAPKLSTVHYHGTWHAPEACGATLSNIAWKTPLWRKHETKLKELLTSRRTVIFIGYSGRDYYDIEPLFRENHFQAKALWLEWSSSTEIVGPREIPNQSKHLRKFRATFDGFSYYSGSPQPIYDYSSNDTFSSPSPLAGPQPWTHTVDETLSAVPHTRLWNFVLDLFCCMGLESEALNLLNEIGAPIDFLPFLGSHGIHLRKPSTLVQDLVQFETLSVEALYLSSRYATMLQRIRIAEKRLQVLGVSNVAMFRYHESAAATFGLFLRLWPGALNRGFRTLASIKRGGLTVIPLSNLDKELFAMHGALHFLFQLLNSPLGRFFGSHRDRIKNDIQKAEASMADLYVARLEEAGGGPYNEYLVQLLQSAAHIYGSKNNQRVTQLRRWIETDNLKQTLILRRHIYYHRRPSKAEIIKGIIHARRLKCDYEILAWLGLAHRHVPEHLDEWLALEDSVSANIETGFPRRITMFLIRSRVGLVTTRTVWRRLSRSLEHLLT